MKLSIIIPAYNEAKRIGATLESIVSFSKTVSYDFEVIVVENNTTDNTRAVAEQFADRLNLKVIDIPLSRAHGGTKGRAVKAGVLAAAGDYVVYMDADNAVDISQIESFWKFFGEGNDVVFGSRYVSEAQSNRVWYRDILGKASNMLVQAVLLPGIKDTQCGFKAFTSTAAKTLFGELQTEGWGFDMEVLALARRKGYRLKEVPVIWQEIGESSVKAGEFIAVFNELFDIKRKIGKKR